MRSAKPIVYDTYTFDLGTARTDEVVDIVGDFMAVTEITGTVTAKFNEKDRSALPLAQIRMFTTPFYRLYLTNTAQAAKTMTVIVGRDAGFAVTSLLTSMRIANVAGTDVNPASLEVLTPLSKASQLGAAELADTDILASVITPTNVPCLIRAMVVLETAGIFSAMLTNGGVTKKLLLNSGVALVAGAAYIFDVLLTTGDTLNFQTSAAGNVTLRVQEIVGAVQ